MRHSRFFGIALTTFGAVMLAALAYEPANVATLLGLKRVLNEATVVMLSLLVIATSFCGGVAQLRRTAFPVRLTAHKPTIR